MLQEHDYNELVIGIITTAGSEKTVLIEAIRDTLRKFDYVSEVIRVTKDVIDDLYGPYNESIDEYKRINYYMDLGNEIREEAESNDILMRGVVSKIYTKRAINQESTKDESKVQRLPSVRKAYIIDSIKHPDEVKFLRNVYKDSFFLIGYTSDYEKRKKYLSDTKNMGDEHAGKILERDEHENFDSGQHVRDAFQLADYFVTNNSSNEYIVNSIGRFLDIIFGNPFVTPSFEEYAMYIAFATSLRTADLSRQIGAVITKNNEVLASGTNDCPRFGGGLYWPIKRNNGEYEDEEGGRDYTLKCDPNKNEQAKIILDILKTFNLPPSDDNKEKLKHCGIGDLTEYGRVVHGEMEALMFCARNHISCRDAEMYVTTFPCHNCAKHIIASGIKRVIYIEPYPKSKALDLYKNELTTDSGEENKLQLVMFEGIGPHRYQDFFSMSSNKYYKIIRKLDNGNIVNWDRKVAAPRFIVPLLNYLEVEEKEVVNYEEFKKARREKQENNDSPC